MTFEEALRLQRRRRNWLVAVFSTVIGAFLGLGICMLGADLVRPDPLPSLVVLIAVLAGTALALGLVPTFFAVHRTERSARLLRISAALRCGLLPADADAHWLPALHNAANTRRAVLLLIPSSIYLLFGALQVALRPTPASMVFWAFSITFWATGVAVFTPSFLRNRPRAQHLLEQLRHHLDSGSRSATSPSPKPGTP